MNAVCPLVTKVHHEAKVRAGKGYTILYVGHAGHDEAVGTLAVAPDAIRLVEHDDDLDARARRRSTTRRKVALLAQTTLALHDWEGIIDRGPRRVPRRCGPRPATTCASRPRTGRPRSRAIATRGRRGRGDRERELVEHDRAGRRSRRDGRAARRVLRVDGPDELDLDALGDARGRRRHRRRERARGARAGGDRAARTRPRASSRCTSPTRTSTSRRRASCAS